MNIKLGERNFLHAVISTVSARLENNRRSSGTGTKLVEQRKRCFEDRSS